MSPLLVRKYPDSILRQQCVSVDKIMRKERNIFEKMLFTMKHFCGIGLAAPQIGIAKKIIVAEVNNRIIKLANPRIVGARGFDNMVEGCLSMPNVAVDVQRPNEIIVQGFDERQKIVEIRMEGLLARVVQHEIDHLEGKLIIDYIRTR